MEIVIQLVFPDPGMMHVYFIWSCCIVFV